VIKINAHVVGDERVFAALRRMEKIGERRAIPKILRKAARPVQSAIRKAAPVQSGALKRSIGTKVKRYRDGTGYYVIIGPRSGMAVEWNGQTRDPYTYGNIVEARTHFMRTAFQQTRPQALNIIASELLAQGLRV